MGCQPSRAPVTVNRVPTYSKPPTKSSSYVVDRN
jgi:hypothetical protein